MLQQDPHGARQAAEERKTPLLRILVLWIRQRKYRKCREKLELKQRTAVLISMEDGRYSRVCWGLVVHWGHTTPCVSPAYCGVWGAHFCFILLIHPPASPWRVWGQALSIFGKLCLSGARHFSSCQECKQIREKPRESKIFTTQIHFTPGSEHDQVYLEWNHLWGKCLTQRAKGNIAVKVPLPAIPRGRKKQNSLCFLPGNNDCSSRLHY